MSGAVAGPLFAEHIPIALVAEKFIYSNASCSGRRDLISPSFRGHAGKNHSHSIVPGGFDVTS
jgi:hypothetical protein